MISEKFGDIFLKIKNYGIIPILKIGETDKAPALAEAISSGGLNVAEITLETDCADCAAEAIKIITETFPDMLIIAGNIRTEEQALTAAKAGAKVVILPEFDEKLISYCAKNKIAVIFECSNGLNGSNADDIKKALDMGIDVIKFISADGNDRNDKNGGIDGIEMIKTLSVQYPKAKFIPASGINGNNFVDYLMQKPVIACAGSFLVQEDSIRGGDFKTIKDLTSQAVRKMLGFDLAHVVMNCENAEQAEQYSSKIESIFGFEKNDAGASVSAAGIIHFMKSKSYGKNGQIAISSNFIDRAVFHLKESGKNFIEESARFNNKGELTSIYLDSLIGGFALKLVPKI